MSAVIGKTSLSALISGFPLDHIKENGYEAYSIAACTF